MTFSCYSLLNRPNITTPTHVRPFSRETGMTYRIVFAVSLAASLALAGTASAQVKFGIGGPITGGSAAFGAQLKNGAEQAIADINAAGGILGQKITSTVGDDRA